MAQPNHSTANEHGTDPTPVPVPPHIETVYPNVEAAVRSNPVMRESGFIRMVTGAMCAITAVFTFALIFWSDQVTSPQWRYLFTFPGGEGTWAVLFGGATLCMVVGLIKRWHRLTAVGNAILGVASALVAVFYAVAPVIDDNMVTFGWYPWLVALIPSTLGAAIYWRPSRWF